MLKHSALSGFFSEKHFEYLSNRAKKNWSSVLLTDVTVYLSQFFDSATILAVDIDQCR